MSASQTSKIEIQDGVQDTSAFFELASSLGDPISLQNGTFVKELQVSRHSEAKPNSLSSRFGRGMFPFHTDTAFWRLPARWVLLRAVSGDLERPTHFMSFEKLFRDLTPSHIRRSAWVCDTGTAKSYSTIFFNSAGVEGFRYDPNCMRPANKAANEVDAVIRPRCFELNGQLINWIPNRVAIIDNWTWLHARGETLASEQKRILQRIYIK